MAEIAVESEILGRMRHVSVYGTDSPNIYIALPLYASARVSVHCLQQCERWHGKVWKNETNREV